MGGAVDEIKQPTPTEPDVNALAWLIAVLIAAASTAAVLRAQYRYRCIGPFNSDLDSDLDPAMLIL